MFRPTGISGVGYVAVLPNGQCIGHLVDRRSHCQLGVSGVELLAERECTRNPDWQLVRLTLTNFASCAEAAFLAERTGMSAVRLRAPLEMQGMEEDLLCKFAAPGDASLTFNFDCDSILAYDAADAHLRRFHSSWCGLDAIVSLGRFSCSGGGSDRAAEGAPLEPGLMYDSELDG
ncbi:hypothetical protein WJX81_008469 [Elliptochloris bilobata]|uniref:Uncharacterized protein n=1 Tax=Elliptochloris bilobata TaxID=381761 RepID=A0AAW1QM07_9CHLO